MKSPKSRSRLKSPSRFRTLRLLALEDRCLPAAVPFALPVALEGAPEGAYAVELYDFNGDGLLDVFTGSYGDTSIAWNANLGEGKFGPKQVISNLISNPDTLYSIQITAGDLNGDGLADVAAASDDVVVHLNLGNGSFGPVVALAQTPDDVNALEVVDLDQDGKNDILVTSFSGNQVGWFQNLGGGTFKAYAALATDAGFPGAVAIADFNADGKPDIVVPDWLNDARALSWYANQGGGTFGPKQVIVSNTPLFRNIAAGDLNGDGHADLAVTFEKEIVWLANNKDATFAAPATVMGGFEGAFDLVIADFDGNGANDVAATDLWKQVNWAPNLGNGNFEPKNIITGESENYITHLAAGDLTGDDLPDLVISDQYPSFFKFIENKFGSSATFLTPPNAGTFTNGELIDFEVYFGFPTMVTGKPGIAFQLGGKTAFAEYTTGSGGLALTFRYQVQADDRALEGIDLVGQNILLNGGAILALDGSPAPLGFPPVDVSHVKVNGSAPRVESIVRLDHNPSNLPKVRFFVHFSEEVVGVDTGDFETFGELVNAKIDSISGSGSAYTVTVSTGSGSGLVGLTVPATATIEDLNGDPLGSGFLGGEVYTLNRRSERTIDQFYTKGHGDIGFAVENGHIKSHIHNEEGEFAPNEVLVVVGPSGTRATPIGDQWAFLGAGEESHWILAINQFPENPLLGFSTEEIPTGTLAPFLPTDPRISDEGHYLQIHLKGVRGPEGGHFSAYDSTDDGPLVWMATSDGIGASDLIYLHEGSHHHLNLGFSLPGHYQVDLVASGYLDANGNGVFDQGIDPYTESGVVTYHFQVNASGDPTPVEISADPLAPPVVVPFGLPQTILTGVGYPYTVAATDLSGDGIPDLLAVATDGSAVTWAENLGGGTFGPKRTIDPGTPSGFIANSYALDFFGTGRFDVLTVGDDNLKVYPNLGGGKFGPAVVIADSGSFRAAVAADLDGDGDTDVATITNTDGKAHWFRNNNDGTFTLAQTFTADLAGARALTALDVEGDGDYDLVVGSNGVNKIALFLNDGKGAFGQEVLVTTDIQGIRNLYQTDLDGDGKTDLVSASYGSSELAWFKNAGDGTFEKRVIAKDSTGIFAAASGDIDGNGTPDLVVAAFDESSVSWYANDGRGNFGRRQVVSSVAGGGGLLAVGLRDINGDGQLDIVAGDTTDPYSVAVYENRVGRFSPGVIPPTSGTALIGQAINVKVHFGVPVAVTGSPEIDLDIGGVTRTAVYASGTGTPVLTFRYVVTTADVDADGILLASTAVRLAGGTLLDPLGAPVNPNLPTANLSGTKVNGSAPLVASVVRLDPAPTNAREVKFLVTFSEAVTGVDSADFEIAADGITGAVVTEVSGSGSEYQVRVRTGTGFGTLALGVPTGASISDLEGNPLGTGFSGGEVYTLHRRPAHTIDRYYTQGHGDMGIGFEDGAWDLHVHADSAGGEFAPGEVLIVGGPDALRDTPQGPEWAFLGAGPKSYWFPGTGAIETLPDLGISAEEIPPGTFAAYLETDPRVNDTGSWLTLQVLAVRAPVGGHFSIYSSGDDGPIVYVSSADGINDTDKVFALQGSHAHYNFAFSEAGHYQVDLVASGYLDANGNGVFDQGIDPYTESGVVTYHFQVNASGDPTPVKISADPLAPPVVVPFGRPELVGSVLAGAAEQVAADLDGDGDLDVAVAAYDANKVVWFENLGSTFAPAKVLSDNAPEPWFITAGDFDGDGKVDVSAGLYSESLIWFRNLGGGAFAPAQTVDSGFTPRLAAGDLNKDGRDDLVTWAPSDQGTAIYFYPGTPNGPGEKQLVVDGLNGVNGLVADDVDQDGDNDILFGEGRVSGIKGLGWVLNNGDGTFGPKRIVAGEFRTNIGRVMHGDLNGDGRLDVLSMEIGTTNVAWYENLGGGEFGPRNPVPISLAGIYTLAVADLNGDGLGDIAAANYSTDSEIVWVPNKGADGFGSQLVVSNFGGQVVSLLARDFDEDGDSDLAATSPSLGQVSFFENKLDEIATEVVSPPSRTYLVGQTLDLIVHLGFPVTVAGTPSIALDVGGKTVQAIYHSGANTPDLVFRYTVTSEDIDADGIGLATSAVALNGGSMTDPLGNPIPILLPEVNLSEVRVNGSAPMVASVTRLDRAATNSNTVRFLVTFSEPVSGVEKTDFGTDAAGVTGTEVTNVSGSGNQYVVVIRTGTGSGTLGLVVQEGASIVDANGFSLGHGFNGGEVYTLQRNPSGMITEFYTQGHGDIGIGYSEGAWDLHVHADSLGEFHPGNVLIVGGAEALRDTPVGPEWEFLGAGPQSFWFPATGAIAGLPDLGIAAEEIQPGTFAAYQTGDPRAPGNLPWLKLQLVGFRGPSGANFSVYKSDDEGPTILFATADGVDETDALYIPQVSHAHYNFAFSEAGHYQVDLVASGYLDVNGNGVFDQGIDPYTESGVVTYHFQINATGEPTPVEIPADVVPPAPIPTPATMDGGANGTIRIVNSDGTTETIRPYAGYFGKVHSASSDFNDDGVADLVTVPAAGTHAHIKVMDGTTGAVLRSFLAFPTSFRGGVSMATGDVTGDGVADLVVAAGMGGGPHVKVFDGQTGDLVRSFFAYSPGFLGGVSVAATDLDGDGVAEIVTGTMRGAPHVKAFRSENLEVVVSFFAYSPGFTGGVYVAAGDLDGDGIGEIVTGTGLGGGPHVRVFDESGAPVHGIMAYEPTFRGGVRVAVRDLNGDGLSEVLTGSGPGRPALVKTYQGRNLQLLDELLSQGPDFLDGIVF